MKKRRQKTLVLKGAAILLACFLLTATSFAADGPKDGDEKTSETAAQKMRGRLEQLFIWRVSDKLHLTSDEETKFATEYKRLSNERTEASAKMDDIVTKLGKEKSEKVKAKLLSDYEEVYKKFTEIQQDEMPAMKKLFNTDRLADYILLKRDMRHRFRDVLAKNGEDAASNANKSKDSPPTNGSK